MKNLITKKNIIIFLINFILLLLIHLPLLTKNIITADILLNDYYYNGYSWEISLGRFGLYIIGIIKSFITIPHIDIIISIILISISNILILDLFKIKDKLQIILYTLITSLSPIISSTLLFNYCSIGYTTAYLSGILSIYIFYKEKNKYMKILLSIILIIISLSMYQAYLSQIVTLFVLYNLDLILNKKENYKEALKYLIIIISSILLYFIIMKLTQIVFKIDMSNYSNADKIGLNTILSIPSKIISSYKLFYKYYFTDSIVKNTYLHNNIINLLLLIILITQIIIKIHKQKITTKNKLIISFLLLTLPIYLNSIIFVINDTKLQLLMSASYLLIPLLIIKTLPKEKYKYFPILIIILLLRNNSIQIQSTYLTLENTFNRYYTIINSTINKNINNLDYKFAIIGKDNIKDNEINKLNYGFISDESLFWDEYNLRKLAFERFTKEYFGLTLEFVSEEEYNSLNKDATSSNITYKKHNYIIINLSNIERN